MFVAIVVTDRYCYLQFIEWLPYIHNGQITNPTERGFGAFSGSHSLFSYSNVQIEKGKFGVKETMC